MTLNLSTLINLRYELESKFKQKLYEETCKVEEKAKNLSTLAFTELYAFFDKLHAAALESDLASMEVDQSSFKAIIGKRFAEGSLMFSEMLLKIKAKQQTKIDEYMAKKVEIESKIANLKAKISEREVKLDQITVKISNIDSQSAKLEDPEKINELDAQIKSVQKDLEENHKQTINDIVTQKKVSEEVKSVAAEMVQQEVEKVKEVAQEASKNDTNANKPADQQTQQLVFEFAKESNEAIKETNTSAKIEDSLVEKVEENQTQKPQEKDPNQLEFDFMKEPEQPAQAEQPTQPEQPVNTQPAVEQPAQPEQPAKTEPVAVAENEIISTTQTGEEVKLEKNVEAEKQDKEKVNAGIATIAENLNVDKNEVSKVVEQVEQSNEVGIKQDQPQTPAQPAAETTPAIAATPEDTVKQKLQNSVETVKTVKETSSNITENVDKKLSALSGNLSESDQKLKQNQENIETIEKTTPAVQEAVADGNIANQQEQQQTTEQKKEIITATTNNLKEVAQQQKEVINVQKEALAALEESAKKLIDDVAIGDVDVNQEDASEAGKKKAISIESLKELMDAAIEMLSDLMEDLFAAVQGKDKQSKITDESIQEDVVAMLSASTEQHTNISSLKKINSITEDEIKKVKTEVFFISGEMQSVDKILKNSKALAEKADKIVVDRQLADVFGQISAEFGEDKVVLDRREGDRREKADRRLLNNNSQGNIFNSTIDQLNELNKIDTSEDSGDIDRREKSDRRNSSDRRQISQISFLNINELDEALQLKNNNWPTKL